MVFGWWLRTRAIAAAWQKSRNGVRLPSFQSMSRTMDFGGDVHPIRDGAVVIDYRAAGNDWVIS